MLIFLDFPTGFLEDKSGAFPNRSVVLRLG